MQRNDETLDTRELASASDPALGDRGASRDVPVATAEVPPATEATDTDSTSASDGPEPLLAAELTTSFNRRWEEVQAQFVDHPRRVVEEADRLVAALMHRLAEDFASQREQLEAHWDGGKAISTEELRVALQRYRAFFQRLLST